MFQGNQPKEIVFTDCFGVSEKYTPKSAVHFIPSWYKEMESYSPAKRTPESLPSIKKCIPVLDAMTAGYIIVSFCDIYISIKDGEIIYQGSGYEKIIDFHPRKQAYKHPKVNDFKFPKFLSPWGIQTPKGYSCLFVSPLHQDNAEIDILEGIVDTDTYHAPVNFPFVLKNPLKEMLIPAGTPIVQVIPFKRDTWSMSLSKNIENATASEKFLNSSFFDRYKHKFWSRKSYK